MDRKPEIRPTTFSKANTVIQVLTIALALFSRIQVSVSGLVSGMIWVAAGTTILTGLQYIYLGTRMTDGTGKNARG
jgi:phosphatidylglycerophosphate synthase